MNAIVEISGKQYPVSEGISLKVARQNLEIGSSLTLDRVFHVDDGKNNYIGTPIVKGASVEASIVENGRDRKVLIYKKKRRKGYQRKNGHRQDYTMLQINKINISSPKKKITKKPAEETAKEV